LAWLFLPLLLVSSLPLAAAPAAGSDALLCAEAIRAAESASTAPRGLLGAVALSESGRYDPDLRRAAPWPWTVNNEGDGRYFATKEAAIAHVESLRRAGRRNIDVGCMQINLLHHADAFASLEEAFDPLRNVAYGADFLSRLREATRSWDRAVERYHTAREDAGRAYRERVYGRWEEARLASADLPRPAVPRTFRGDPAALEPSLRGTAALRLAMLRGRERVEPASGRIGPSGDGASGRGWGRIARDAADGPDRRPAVFPERRSRPAGAGSTGAVMAGGVLELIPAATRVDVLRPARLARGAAKGPQVVAVPGSRLRLVSSRRILTPEPDPGTALTGGAGRSLPLGGARRVARASAG
jgi:hypothetical protein